MAVEPVPDSPAAIADTDGKRTLVIADYHAGIEADFRAAGVSIDSRAPERRERLLALVADHDPDRLVVCGDFMHSIGAPGSAERGEIERLVEALPDDLAVTVAKGNHDGAIASWVPSVTVTAPGGVRDGAVGFCHGHAWPAPDLLAAETICIGHEHPQVRLTDEVGGARIERAWLRGPLVREPFAERGDDSEWNDPSLVVVPAFNDLVGGTWLGDGDFLAPFLPAALPAGDAYLLDGTLLGDYRGL
jgi:putative SbcD/Mre11-related phosphoesterase